MSPARPLRSMQTGQNSIVPEKSLPQLAQVRWDSLLMFLTAFQPQPETNNRASSSSAEPSSNIASGSPLGGPLWMMCQISSIIKPNDDRLSLVLWRLAGQANYVRLVNLKTIGVYCQ